MIKLTFCLVRAPHLTLPEFQDYWLNKHAPLVTSFREVLRIRKYVQAHSLDPSVSEVIRNSRGLPDQFDGVAQLWWDNMDDVAFQITGPWWRTRGISSTSPAPPPGGARNMRSSEAG